MRKSKDTRGWHPASRFTTVGGDRCHYLDVGPADGEVLVLLHGIAVSSWAWRFNLDALSKRFRVIAPCQRGFGWSTRDSERASVAGLARFVWGLLDQLGIERASLCGNSLGGAVTLWSAQHYPERVDRLILVNPAALVSQLPWRLLHSQLSALAPVYRSVVGKTLMRTGLRMLAYRGLPVDSTYMAGFWTPWSAPGAMKSLLAVARGLPASIREVDDNLDQVEQPTLIVWGELDGLLSVSGGHALAQRIPHARLILFDRSGHCPHEEEPARFNAVVTRFVDGTDPA
jgi:pimeloyl-ACP methyl ester carboxylesterase